MLENLNEKQKEAVTWQNGPLLVLAGAGTGKTTVLTTRIAYILNMGWAYPWEILALTFTNKAANEMKKRVAAFANENTNWHAEDLWCGTFHSICLRILRANASRIGLQRNFIIFGEDEQKSVIKTIIKDSTKTPAEYVEEFSRIKDKGLSALNHKDKTFQAYNAELSRLNAVDFGDIILKVLQLFEENSDVLSHYQKQFKHVLVDEFQDINNSQMEFIKYILPPQDENDYNNRYLFCVGDEDQSIYSWRGAEIKHILDFEKNYGNAKIIIDSNYRSTPNILGAANSLIKHNKERIRPDKALHAIKQDNNEPVYVLTVPSDLDEVRVIADAITRDGTGNYKNIAVLIRAGSLSRLFEEEFGRRGIPFRLVGATKFYDRMEVRDAIAYIRLLAHPFDDISFMRVISKPRRGFGAGAIEKLRTAGGCMMNALNTVKLSGKQQMQADKFLSAFDFDWQSIAPRDAAMRVLEESGYMAMWRESKDADAPDRLNNIRELITNVVGKYDTIDEFLEQAALMTTDDDENGDIKNNADAVNVMTIHAAKGLEFDTVFLPAWEEGIFPNDKAISEGALEEERRLAYVAITRARRRAVISNAMSRMIFGNRQYNSPSRFITEMDNHFLDFQGGMPRPTPAYNTYRSIETSYQTRPATRTPQRPRTVAGDRMTGKLVAHAELGHGTVIEDNGDILTVAFGARGIKKVARNFVKLLS